MRHRKSTKRLGRSPEHRKAMVAALLCGLITDKRINTTLVKARIARQAAEKLVTVARRGTLAARRQVASELRRPSCVKELVAVIVPQLQARKGGYTRIVKLGHRPGDGADTAILEWVDVAAPVRTKVEAKPDDAKKD